MRDRVAVFVQRVHQRRLLDTDLKRYAEECGPEPIVDRFKPDLVGQKRSWEAYWLEWYRRPMADL